MATTKTTAAEAKKKASTAREQAEKAGAKLPADRQTASEDVKDAPLVRLDWGKAPDGPDGEPGEAYTYELDRDSVDDLEVLEALDDANQGNGYAVVRALRLILGPEQWSAYKSRARGSNGRVKASDATSFFKALMDAVNKGN